MSPVQNFLNPLIGVLFFCMVTVYIAKSRITYLTRRKTRSHDFVLLLVFLFWFVVVAWRLVIHMAS